MRDLLALMNPVLPIQIADFQTHNFAFHFIGGRGYYGNEYFYTNIARQTSANYHNIRNSGYSFNQLTELCFQSLSGYMSAFELHTTLQNGFCYARYDLNPPGNEIYLDRPILQVGKYSGDLPFIVEASGFYRSQPFFQRFLLEEPEISITDSLSEEMWVGNYIRALEAQTQTNTVIAEIIDQSINERVLSRYSAFLCLDPARGGEICYECVDETQLVTGIAETPETEADSLLQVYPNPFNAQTTITVNLRTPVDGKHLQIRIFNILGQLVRTFRPEIAAGQRTLQVKWDGTNDQRVAVASGTYLLVVQTPTLRKTMKLLLTK